MPASTGGAVDRWAEGRWLAVDYIDDQLEATGLALTAFKVDQMTRERRIQILTGQVDTQQSAQLAQGNVRQYQVVEFIELALGFRFGAADVGADARETFQLARVTPHCPRPPADIVGKFGRALQGLVRGEDRFGM